MLTRNIAARSLAGAVALGASAIAAYAYVVRPWHQRWGATADEAAQVLPGDELAPDAQMVATHAVTVRAPAEQVWPWLAQIGQGRGGFYSYTWIENLLGADIHNTDRLLPEWQHPHVGDTVPLAQSGFGVPIAVVEPPKTLVLHGDTRQAQPGEMQIVGPGHFLNVVWGWHLAPAGAQSTRLIERWRAEWDPCLENDLYVRAFLEPGAFVMERAMLLGIKRRAEALASRTTVPQPA